MRRVSSDLLRGNGIGDDRRSLDPQVLLVVADGLPLRVRREPRANLGDDGLARGERLVAAVLEQEERLPGPARRVLGEIDGVAVQDAFLRPAGDLPEDVLVEVGAVAVGGDVALAG